MGTTKNSQIQIKRELDQKLEASVPNRQVLEDLAVGCAKDPNPDNTFQYAFCLSKSRERSELRYAVTILDGLVKEGYEHQVDCMYGSATALYLLKEYDQARTRCEAILRCQPESRVAAELHLASMASLEEEEQRKLRQAAIGGTAAMIGVGALAAVGSLLFTKR